MTRKYRKKPVVIEAVEWTGNNRTEICEFIDQECFEFDPHDGLVIHTLEGDHHASVGDYIIKGVHGEFYPCKPDIFEKTYEDAALRAQAEAEKHEPLTICDFCIYDPPSSLDGKPCCMCPAEAKRKPEEGTI